MKLDHEKNIMEAQLEIQAATFEQISQEIHDSINLSLTLAKLQLNTIDWKDQLKIEQNVNNSIELVTDSICKLSNISRSLNADIIGSYGLIQALENEVKRIQTTAAFEIHFSVMGDPIYMENRKELVIFRIVQEGFNNIIKHAKPSLTTLTLYYNKESLQINISDDGVGFKVDKSFLTVGRAGLHNMKKRTTMLGGRMNIDSQINKGTKLEFIIPI